MTFCAVQKLGSTWKSNKLFKKAPFIVQKVMENNFMTPVGLSAIVAGRIKNFIF
jgi:hypothetical protein